MTDLQQKLFALQDKKYRNFHSALMPTVAKENVIGVRVPQLRKFAKEFAKSDPQGAERFLTQLPHKYYEENNLHAFLLEQSRDFSATVAGIENFLPYIDNWATCDMLNPKALKKDLPTLYKTAFNWCDSAKTYTVHYGIKTLMTYFLDGAFVPEVLAKMASIKSDEYYVNMMSAWFFATALAKQYQSTLPYFEKRLLFCDVHNKAISKARDSLRIENGVKEYLKSLRY